MSRCPQCDVPATNGRWCEAHAQIIAWYQDHHSGKRKVDPSALFLDYPESAFLAALPEDATFMEGADGVG